MQFEILLYFRSCEHTIHSFIIISLSTAVVLSCHSIPILYSRYMELFRPRIVAVPFRIQKTDTLKLLKSTFPELQHREDVGELFTPLKSKKFSYCKHILLLQDGMAEKQKGSNLFFDAIVYGPSGYYESPLRRIAMTMTPDDPVLILLDDKDVHSARPIVFSHRNLLNAGHLIAQKADIKHGDRVVVTHRQQNMLGTLASYSCLVSRATLIFPAPLFDAKECLKQIDEEQATVLFGSADELKELLDVKEGLDLKLPHLKTVVVDSSATSDAISGFEERFGIKVVHVSGINEASGAMLIDNQISNNTEFKIARAHDGKIVHRDTYGDLKIRGYGLLAEQLNKIACVCDMLTLDFFCLPAAPMCRPTVARGWWNDIGLMNPDIDEDGWFNTGRVAKIDANGNLDMQ